MRAGVVPAGWCPVAIKQAEEAIAEIGWGHGYITPHWPSEESRHRVAVVGSGPAGLAAAQQLSRVGHVVTVYERADRLGGLLRYEIPEFKMEKAYSIGEGQSVARAVDEHLNGESGLPSPVHPTELPLADV